MKQLRIFRAQGDCGCGPTSQSQVSSTPCMPGVDPTAVICDNKYYNLGMLTMVRLLGVPVGGNCQQFLKPAVPGGRGFVFVGPDGQAYVEGAPRLTLPLVNPAVAGAFPATGTFQYLMIGTAADPSSWMFFSAPTAGEYTLGTLGGQWRLRDAGTVGGGGGATNVCATNQFATKGVIVTCINTGDVDPVSGDPIYALRKLTAAHQRVVVGDVDGLGVAGFKCLPDLDTLNHPLAAFNDLKAAIFRQIHAGDGSVEGDGIPAAILTGVGAVIDGRLIMYSGTTNKFYTLPARTKENLTVNADVAVADNGTYVSMGGHCLFSNLNFNHPDFFIAATIRMANDADNYVDIDFALFIDNVNVHSWDVKGSKDTTLVYLHKALAIGIHTVDIRFRQTAAAGNSTIKYSDCTLHTVL